MDIYPHNLIEKYLRASSKLKKFERVVFKRFGPNVIEVQNEFAQLALKFEDGAIYPYAAMCHLGVAKCEYFAANTVGECHAFLKAARTFLRANDDTTALLLRSSRNEYMEGALRCYTQAHERCVDDSVLKAAIIREMTPLQMHYDGTSTFASPAHRIHELELAANACLKRRDFFVALQHLDDIVDNVEERKRQSLYMDLLQRVEVLRLLLLVHLNLPPARQSPSHIKLVDYYYRIGNFDDLLCEEQQSSLADAVGTNCSNSSCTSAHLPMEMKYALAEIVLAWSECKPSQLKLALEQLAYGFSSLNEMQLFVLNCICENIEKIL